jgi:hypothetical protein
MTQLCTPYAHHTPDFSGLIEEKEGFIDVRHEDWAVSVRC